MKYIFESFNSVAQFVKTIDERPEKDGWGSMDSKTSDSYWTGTESYEAATKLALYGDIESSKRVNKSLKKIRDAKAGTEERAQNKVMRTVIGTRPCVPAAVVGHPCSMYRRNVIKVKKPVVTVYYSISMDGGTSADVLENAGAKMAEVIQIIERSGVRVNLYAGNTSCTRSQSIGCFVQIKDSAKDFDLLRMAYPLINPSFFRRHWFRWVETKKELITSEWRHGYGRPLRRQEEENTLTELRKNNIKCDYLFTTENILSMSVDDIVSSIIKK